MHVQTQPIGSRGEVQSSIALVLGLVIADQHQNTLRGVESRVWVGSSLYKMSCFSRSIPAQA